MKSHLNFNHLIILSDDEKLSNFLKIIKWESIKKQAGEKVQKAMHKKNREDLKSGNGKKLTSNKQAAIGIIRSM